MAPGASITSLGPNGYNNAPCLFGCFDSRFQPNINFQNGTVNLGGRSAAGRGHHRGRGVVGGYGYSYAYPYPVVVVPVQDQEVEQSEYEAEPPAPTVYERRPVVRLAPNPTPGTEDDSRYGQHYLDSRERREPVQEEATPRRDMTPEPEPIPIIVIFKDGHQKEISNYAIVGDTLYELGAVTSHKIKLADLDLKATADKNEERGVEFNLPGVYKPKA